MRKVVGKPHIVHILGSSWTGGAQKVVLNLISSRALGSYRHSVIFTFGPAGNLFQQFAETGTTLRFCLLNWPPTTPLPSYQLNKWLRRKLQIIYPFRLAATLRSLRADVVHSHLISALDLQAEAVVNKAQLPWLYTAHGLFRADLVVPHTPQKIAALINGSTASIVGVSQAALDSWLSRANFNLAKAQVIYNGINLDDFTHGIPRQLGLRTQWGIPDEAILFGSAGRLVSEKNYELFVQAASQLVQDNSSAYFAVAGDGYARRFLEQKIAEFGMANRFRLIGMQSDIRCFMRELDVFVLPSRNEAFGIVLLEACAMGIPCIGTNVGGIPEILGEGVGLLVESDNPEKLADAMRTMLDEKIRLIFSQRSLEAVKNFALEKTIVQYESLYKQLLTSTASLQ